MCEKVWSIIVKLVPEIKIYSQRNYQRWLKLSMLVRIFMVLIMAVGGCILYSILKNTRAPEESKASANNQFVNIGGNITITQSINAEISDVDLDNIIARHFQSLNEAQRKISEQGILLAKSAKENQDLKQNLRAAITRVEHAEKTSETARIAKIAIEQLRVNGDLRPLQELLTNEKDKNHNDIIQRNREVATLAYLMWDLKSATKALSEILTMQPNDIRALNMMGIINISLGNLKDAEKEIINVIRIAIQTGDQLYEYSGRCNLSSILLLRGELDQAERIIKESIPVFEKAGWQKGIESCYGNLGLIYRRFGKYDLAEEMHKKSLLIDQMTKDYEGESNNYLNLGLVYCCRGELEKAEEMYKRSLSLNEEYGFRKSLPGCYNNLGSLYRMRGQYEIAESMHKKALELYQIDGCLRGMADAYGNIGITYALQKKFLQAEEMLKRALELNEQMGCLEGMAVQYCNLGGVYIQRNDLPRTEETLKNALKIHEKLKMIENIAMDYVNLGTLYKKKKDYKAARDAWIEAISCAEQVGLTSDASRIREMLKDLPDESK
ncbi:MAG: tetratricopeptide repeat protein [Candidatus Sumerlaeia bacterium]